MNESEIFLITDNLINIENLYKCPVDIEFGLENNILYILQARPITSYNKLPEEFLTSPKEQRILYFEDTLGLQGIEKNLSILGSEIYFFKMRYILESKSYLTDIKDEDFFS